MARSPKPLARPRVCRTELWTPMILLSVVVFLLVGTDGASVYGGALPAPARAVAHPAASAALSSPMDASIAALEAGQGPSQGRTASCATVGAGGLTCSATRMTQHALGPHPLSSSSPSWVDLTKTIATSPPFRYIAMMAYDPVDQYVVLFGGTNTTATPSQAFSDTWTFAGGQWTQIFPSSTPGGRAVASMVWDAKDGYILLFGGYNEFANGTSWWYNDTWTFLHGNWNPLSPAPSPSQRWRANTAYDAADGYVVLFGGTGGNGAPLSDTWKFVGGNWTDITTKVHGSPPGRYRATTTYDAKDGYVVVFGGCTSTTCPPVTSDTWTYVNLNWTHLAPTSHPNARVYAGMTYDAQLGSVVLFGGSASSTAGPMRDTWTFVNGSWTNVTTTVLGTPPSSRGYEVIAYDGFEGYTLLFSGYDFIKLHGDTWTFGPSIVANLQVQPGSVDRGQSTLFNTSAASTSPWLSYNYTGLPAGCTGMNTSKLNCTAGAVGSYLVKVFVNGTAGANRTVNGSLTVRPDPSFLSYTVTPATVTAGSNTTFSVSVTGGTAPIAFSYSGMPAGCPNSNTGNLTCRPSASGTFTVEVRALDTLGVAVFDNVTLHVNAQPSIPTFVATRNLLDVGQWTNLSVGAIGGTGTLGYVYTGLPTPCVTASAAHLSCLPNQAGLFGVNVTVTDQFNWSASKSLFLNVDPAPNVTAFVASPSTFDAGSTVTLWLNVTGGTGTYNYTYAGAPSGCILADLSKVSCVPGSTGTFMISGVATDQVGGSVAAHLTLQINSEPTITSFTAQPGLTDVGLPVNFSVVSTGGTAPFSFQYSGLPAGCAASHAATFVCTPTVAGVPAVTAQLSDHFGKTTSATVIVTINAAPGVSSFTVSPASVNTGQTATLSVVASGGSGGYSYTYSGLPSGCVSANVSALRCTTSSTGTFTVTVTVSDSLGAHANRPVTYSVTSPPSASNSLLGSSSGTLLILVGVVAAAAVVGALLYLRRRGASREAPPPSSGAGAEEPASYDESVSDPATAPDWKE